MAQHPYMPLWTDAYLGDTFDLTTTEHGAYLLLLMAMWRADGSLPDNDRDLARFARLTPGQWRKIKPRLMQFFKVENGRITQGRLTDELNAVRQKRKSQSQKAKARWLKNKETGDAAASAGHSRGNASHSHNHNHKESTSYEVPANKPSQASEAIAVYNAATEETGWPKVQRETKPRLSAITARLKDCDGIEGWLAAIDKAKASDFLCGRTPQQFFATFDWLTKPANFTKLMEGNYDNRPSHPPSGPGSNSGADATDAAVRLRLARRADQQNNQGGTVSLFRPRATG